MVLTCLLYRNRLPFTLKVSRAPLRAGERINIDSLKPDYVTGTSAGRGEKPDSGGQNKKTGRSRFFRYSFSSISLAKIGMAFSMASVVVQ